jgi:hypothetical protein
MLSFIELMRLFGILFIILLPLIWLAKSSRAKAKNANSEKNQSAVNPVES